MACFKPLTAYKGKDGGRMVFNTGSSLTGVPIQLACGQCSGCRIDKTREWSIRMAHEASLYENNCFITLTYDDDHLPKNQSLQLDDIQLFLKTLRNKYCRNPYPADIYPIENKQYHNKHKIRFYQCGEYGESTFRAHHHACMFNWEPSDQVLFAKNDTGNLYTSETLTELWGKGHCTVAPLTIENAAYTARYTLKKVTGDQAEEHYKRLNPETGELISVKPEFATMSRRPGIGSGWYDKYKNDLNKDFLVIKGNKLPVPKFYDKQLKKVEPEKLEMIKLKRQIQARKHKKDQTPERLAVREKCLELKLKRVNRGL